MSRRHHDQCTALVCVEPEYRSGCTAGRDPDDVRATSPDGGDHPLGTTTPDEAASMMGDTW